MATMRGLTVFIADLRKCKARELEERRINKELANIRTKFRSGSSLSGYDRKKYICKLLYMFILGYEVDFGHHEIINLLHSPKFSEKQIGYLAATLLLSSLDKSDFLRQIIGAMRKDLASANDEFSVCLALHAIANIGERDMADVLARDVAMLLMAPSVPAMVQKKAALCLLRLYRKHPDVIPAAEWSDRIVRVLEHPDLGVATAGASLVTALAQQYPEAYMRCVPLAVDRLHRIVVQREYHIDYVYYGVPVPWLQVKLLRLLQYFAAPGQGRTRHKLVAFVQATMDAAQETPRNMQQANALNAVLFEAIAVAIHLGDESVLLQQASQLLARFISSRETNIRYLGLQTMSHLASSLSDLTVIHQHHSTIFLSLRDRDLSVRRRGLDLLYSMCDMAHARTIVHELLRFLNSTTDQSLRQEIVLKVAILAENYATEYSWYVDVMMRVLNAGDDCVGDEMWFRVVQVVLANEALQTYACQAAMDALASPASSESAVKVAAYILGEFGHLATGPPVDDDDDDSENGDTAGDGKIKESGQNAVYFSAADQLGALKNKLAVSNSSTRALILTSLLKQANLFPESRSSIIAIFQHYRHSLDVEIQQRASEYLTVVANPDAELLATVCEEIPPFPERESTLVSSLHRKHLDTVDKRTWIVGGAEANRELQRQHTQGKQSPSSSAPASATNSNQRSNNAGQQPPPLTARYTVYEDAARQQERSDARNLVELVEEQWRPSISNNGNNNNNNSNMDVVANESQSDKLMSSLDGILYADVNIQVGFKCEFSGSEGRVVLYIGNSSQRDLTDFDASINSEDDSLISTIQLPSPAQNVIKPRTQLMVKISLKCQSIFGSSPIVIIRYTLGQPRTLLLRLPVSITRFMNPVVLSAQDFFQRWKQLASPSNTNEESKECQLTLYSSLAETNSTNTSALRSIITGLGLSSLDGIDPNMGNIVGVGVINAGQLGNIGCLMRLEPSAEREMFRLTVRTTNPKTSTIVAAIIKRAISAIDDTNAN